MTLVDTHVEPQYVRHPVKTHGVKTRVADELTVPDGYEDLGFPYILQANALCKGFFSELIGIRHEQGVKLPNDGALCRAQHPSVTGSSITDGSLHVA